VALTSLCVAIASWFRPTEDKAHPAEPGYSEQQIADAKSAVCDAYDVIYKALQTAGARSSSDESIAFALAVEMKLAFHASGDYLVSTIHKNPATPTALARATQRLADAYHRVILDQLGEAPDTQIDLRKSEIDEAELEIRGECGE
jgi:hypothetical protein